MRLHCPDPNHQLVGDLGVGETGGQQGQHLSLARSQFFQRLGTRPLVNGAVGESLDRSTGDGAVQECSAAGYHPDRLDKLLRGRVLEQKAAGPGSKSLIDVLVEIEGREHDDAGRPGVGLGRRPR